MRVGIIGAGAAGLASARQVIQKGFHCDVFEIADQIGGVWVYTDRVGHDEYGYPVYSAMYQNLRTNLPKEVMGFPDFPVPDQEKSYLTQKEVLQFLNQYADYFGLSQHVKLNCMVTNVRPLPNNKWELTHVFKHTNEVFTDEYDAIMVCNGHYNEPLVPTIENIDNYSGEVIHSHIYRSAEKYKDKRILTVGAGPSGLDLTLQVSRFAKKVYFSHHSERASATTFPPNVEHMPDVKRIIGDKTVEFVNGCRRDIDVILLCTGYRYNFPFLHESCGITMEDNFIQPLYKHMIHLEKPTLSFIGIPFNVCTFHMFDLQARYFCEYLNGSMSLPSTEEMRRLTDEEMRLRWDTGLSKKNSHMMGKYQESYYNDLAKDANIETISPVYVKLRDISISNLYTDLMNFRDIKYKIIDDENYIKFN
ncbi:unnamed protein product [Phyllotreta striolata]|uniref:Flavin-containing monooxygenase n=1 Tax=Phyllotreta striolata TaxID=444603 RepID=A0A9N9TSG0_PHYSR|nr:unnamed protein product [Phyllotreta striolata]